MLLTVNNLTNPPLAHFCNPDVDLKKRPVAVPDMIDLASSLSSIAGTEEIIVNIRRDDVNNPTICKETMHDTVADRHCTQSIAHESPALENMIHDLRPAHCSLQSCCLSDTIQQSIRAANA